MRAGAARKPWAAPCGFQGQLFSLQPVCDSGVPMSDAGGQGLVAISQLCGTAWLLVWNWALCLLLCFGGKEHCALFGRRRLRIVMLLKAAVISTSMCMCSRLFISPENNAVWFYTT